MPLQELGGWIERQGFICRKQTGLPGSHKNQLLCLPAAQIWKRHHRHPGAPLCPLRPLLHDQRSSVSPPGASVHTPEKWR